MSQASLVDMGGVIAIDGRTSRSRTFPHGSHGDIRALGSLPDMNNVITELDVAEGCRVELFGGLNYADRRYEVNADYGIGKGTVRYQAGPSTFPTRSITSMKVHCDRTKYCTRSWVLDNPACAYLMAWDAGGDELKRAYCNDVVKTMNSDSAEYDACSCISVGPGDPRKDPAYVAGQNNGKSENDPSYVVEEHLHKHNFGNNACWSPRCRGIGTNPDARKWQLQAWWNPVALNTCKLASICSIDMSGVSMNLYGGVVVVDNSCEPLGEVPDESPVVTAPPPKPDPPDPPDGADDSSDSAPDESPDESPATLSWLWISQVVGVSELVAQIAVATIFAIIFVLLLMMVSS